MLAPRVHTVADGYNQISRGPFPEHYVHWDWITLREANEFKQVIETAPNERPVQCFIEITPRILAQHLNGGWGRWVIPQKKLGDRFIADFVVGEANSLGHFWTGVELESPTAKLFTKSGDPAKSLNHAIRQIQDWRGWLEDNRDYARRPREDGGLGLKGLKGVLPGLVIIGRRATLSESDNRLRRQYSDTLGIKIRTYDYLIDEALRRATWLEKGVEIP